ncbi:MAG: alpha-beta hydrolase superfamily lysophospholipase [Halieaceae bacterium]|jgi:alpha-beta hydrolase superfamily lysophospholipase
MGTASELQDVVTVHCEQHCLDSGVFYRHWPVSGSGQSPVRAVILMVHGLGEHSGRYENFARYFNSEGVAVVAPDHLGHGRSPGVRGHIDSFSDYLAPLDELRGKIREWYPQSPCFLVGHSLGGLIAVRHLIERQDGFDGAALSAAALQVAVPPSKLLLIVTRLLAAVRPTLGVMQLEATEISRDPDVVQRYVDDPMVHHGKISAGLVINLFKAMAEVEEGSSRVSLPLLIMHGEKDVMTSPAGSVALHGALGSADKSLSLYPGLFHELFNEPERLEVLAELRDWIQARA